MLIAHILVQLPRPAAIKAAQALCDSSFSSHSGRMLIYVFDDYSRLLVTPRHITATEGHPPMPDLSKLKGE
jgi:hypothetical protein